MIPATTILLPHSSCTDAAELKVAHAHPFVCRLIVGTDVINPLVDHVANTQYPHWLDRVAELHCDSLGYTRHRMLADGRMWFVGRHEIDYHMEAHAGDELLIATWVRDIDRVKSWRDTVFLRKRVVSDPDARSPAQAYQRIVSSSTLWVYVDLAKRRATSIPMDVARRFEPLTIRVPAPVANGRVQS